MPFFYTVLPKIASNTCGKEGRIKIRSKKAT